MSYRIQGTGFLEQKTVNFNLDDALELNEMKRTTEAEEEAKSSFRRTVCVECQNDIIIRKIT